MNAIRLRNDLSVKLYPLTHSLGQLIFPKRRAASRIVGTILCRRRRRFRSRVTLPSQQML